MTRYVDEEYPLLRLTRIHNIVISIHPTQILSIVWNRRLIFPQRDKELEITSAYVEVVIVSYKYNFIVYIIRLLVFLSLLD